MSALGSFNDTDLQDDKVLLRKLNDNVTAANATAKDVENLLRFKPIEIQFRTLAYINPYDAPFPLTLSAVGRISGLVVGKIEKAGMAGSTRGVTAGVSILWSALPDGRLRLESMTGLSANTDYICTLIAFLG